MGTNGGLARFDGKEITFFPSGLSQRLIGMKIAPAPDGRVWYMGWISDQPSVFGTFENGIFTDKKSLLSHPPDTEVIRDMAWSEKGNALLVYFQPHLYEIRDNQARILHTMQDSMFILVKQGKEIFFVESSDYENFKVLEYTGSGLVEAARVRNGKTHRRFPAEKESQME